MFGVVSEVCGAIYSLRSNVFGASKFLSLSLSVEAFGCHDDQSQSKGEADGSDADSLDLLTHVSLSGASRATSTSGPCGSSVHRVSFFEEDGLIYCDFSGHGSNAGSLITTNSN